MPTKAVSVAVRCRISLPHDKDQRVCVRTVGEREITCLDPEHLYSELREKHGRHDYLKENHCRERAYTFDAVFGPTSTNVDLFDQLARPLVPEVLAGKHATCFAYGQTGSGKTHTMLGRQGESGLTERTLRKLLEDAKPGTSVGVTFVEVYNEKIRDLLHTRCPVLDLRDDPTRGPCIAGVREVPATTADAVMAWIREGNTRRTEETTLANPVSSRSHAVLQIIVETEFARGKKRCAKLSLIDLAGSERAANTGNRGARLREGAMINKSLLALANCITALTRKGAYVNYRDSKLTRLLKDSLSGNCYTMMVAHVSPSIAAFEETVNTLKYAHRACEIRGLSGGVRENVVDVAAKYADRLQPCLEATSGLKRMVTQIMAHKPPPASIRASSKRPHDHSAVAAPVAAPPAVASKVVALADALEKTRKKVINQMRERTRIEQTAMELDDQNEANQVELSKIELDSILGGAVKESQPSKPLMNVAGTAPDPVEAAKKAEGHLVLLKKHGALRAATRNNDAQRRRVEHQSAVVMKSANKVESEAKLVSLLTDARAVIDGELGGDKSNGAAQIGGVEKRLLEAHQALSLLEIEKVEAEQAKIMLEAAARQHDLALRKQSLKMDVHVRALMSAQALLGRLGLIEEWHKELGCLAKLIPQHAPTPGLDELIAELSAPASPVDSRPASCVDASGGNSGGSPVGGDWDADSPRPVEAQLKAIDEGFNEMRMTLRRTASLMQPSDEPAPSDEGDEDMEELPGGDEDDDVGSSDGGGVDGRASGSTSASASASGNASVRKSSRSGGPPVDRSGEYPVESGYGGVNHGGVNWIAAAVAGAAAPAAQCASPHHRPPAAAASIGVQPPSGALQNSGWGPTSVGFQPSPRTSPDAHGTTAPRAPSARSQSPGTSISPSKKDGSSGGADAG